MATKNEIKKKAAQTRMNFSSLASRPLPPVVGEADANDCEKVGKPFCWDLNNDADGGLACRLLV